VLLKVFLAVRLQLQLGSDGVGESHRKERGLIAILASPNNVLVVGQRRSSKVFRIFLLASASSLPRRRARVFEIELRISPSITFFIKKTLITQKKQKKKKLPRTGLNCQPLDGLSQVTVERASQLRHEGCCWKINSLFIMMSIKFFFWHKRWAPSTTAYKKCPKTLYPS
jgi:hypothetical protein